MSRYVLRYTGTGPVPTGDLERVRACAHVVDVAGRTLLVGGAARRVQAVVHQLDGWVASPETVVPVPRTRPTVHAAAARRR